MKINVSSYIKILCFSVIMVSVLFSSAVFPCASASSNYSGTVLSNRSTIDNALAGTVVNCMLQDSTGFLWFGTQAGLYRYNGYSLKSYIFSSNSSSKFNSNFITSICEDNLKNIWIGTFGGGVFKLDSQTGEYINFNSNSQGPDAISDNNIRTIYMDGGKLWIGTQNKGLDCLDLASRHFTHYKNIIDNADSISSNAITSICKDSTGTLWVGTIGGGLNKLDSQSDKFVRIKLQDNYSDIIPNNMSDNNISKLYTDRGGVLWIVTGNGRLCGLNTYSGEFMDSSSYNLNELKVSTICEDSSGVLWIGTYGNGVRMLDKEKKEFTAYGCRFSQDTPFCNYRVICLFADSSGNLWIGTEGSGIGRINTNLKFMSYNSNPDSGIKFSDDVVLSILKDNSGLIWVGTANGGINRFDRENNQVAFYKNNPGDESSISSNTVCSIYEDSKKNLWFGTINGTLSRLDSESGKFVNYNIKNFENTNFTDNGILMIREGRDGILWACAANGGLVRYDTNTGQFTQFTNNPWKPDSISSNHVLSIAEDETGMIWIGTSGGGLNKLDPSSNKFTYYGINEMDSNTQLFNYSINAILNDNGVLWLATDKGLFKFDKNSGESVLVEDAQQTAGTAIFGLLKDNNGNLWLSTINGLVKYYISSDVFKKYNFCEGLHSNQYTSGSYFKGSDGEMFFGGINGFSCFYPEKIRDNSHKPPVVIADLKIFDTLVKIPDTGIVTLSYKDDFISIEFAALDYADPLKNQYAYMLDGFDKDWHYNSTRNYVSYTNLDGGEYVLRVKASNNDGLWNDLETQIKIIIAPPFWETVWFLIAVITFIVLIIVVSVRIRVKALKLKSLEIEQQIIERTRDLNQANEQLRHTDQMKSNFLSMVSHEIRTPLSTLLGFTELIADKIENIIFPNLNVNDSRVKKAMEKIGRDLNIIISEGDRLSVLVNNLLNISKIESGKIDMKNESINIPEIIEQSLLVTKPIVEKAGLSLSVDIEADLPEIVGDRDMLIQVFINLISNAVKYTKEGHIRICAVNSGSSVLFSVEDTGIGIPETHIDKVFDIFYKVESSIANNVGTGNMGLGLSICKQIVEKHGGDIQVKSQYGKGSVFYFTIPVGNGS